MKNNKIEETHSEPVEDVEIIELTEDASIEPDEQVVHNPKKGVFFPNLTEGFPFGGEFETDEEAAAANTHYLNKMKGSK